MKKHLWLSAFVVILMSISAFAVAEEPEVKQYVICKNQKIVRTIRVECTKGECDTIYTKDGTDRVEGHNNNVFGGQKILSNIKGNLEKAAWKCNDITANAKIDQ
jgi:hypothetical protein